MTFRILGLTLGLFKHGLRFNSFLNGIHMDDVVALQKNLDVVTWKTAENLTLVDGLSNPNLAKTQYNLGVQLFPKDRYDEAVLEFRR